jgi:O-antigen/teichoic acid export membrane protein
MAQGVDIYFEDHQESRDLGRRAVRGGVVSVAMQYGNGVLQIVAAVVLARLLTPADFGLVAIVTVLTSFAPLLIDFGLGDATAQRTKITPSQISSLFWLSLAVGLAVAVALAACSPLIAAIYRQPELEPIALCTSTTFVLWGAANQHLALLRRTMQFGRIARIQLLGSLVGIAIAIALAIRGYGYWALVARPIANALCVVAGAWLACRWRPGLPAFDDEVKSMVRFGFHVVGFSVTYTLAKAVDRIALGLFYRPAQVGYYQNAVTLYENSIFSVFSQVHNVGSAALSKLQSNVVALKEKYEAALSALAFFVMPAAAILSVTGEDIAVILLGEKWRAAGWLLRVIALRGIFQVVEMSQGWLHLSIGRADRWRNWGIISLAMQVAAVLAGLPFGPTGVAFAGVVGGQRLPGPPRH